MGPEFGLSIILDVKQDDYFFDPIGNNLDAGVKFRIHPSYEPPDIEIEGKYVGTGKKVYTVLSLQDENMLPNPWGACDPAKEQNVKLKFYSQYTRQGCLQECYREKVIKKCGCVPFNHILNYEKETERECSLGLERGYARRGKMREFFSS